jgi:hypothetical protein
MLVSSELTGIEDVVVSSIREIFFKFGLGGHDEHIFHEEGVIRTSANDSDLDSVFGIPASISINDVYFTSGVEVALGEFREKVERSSCDGSVDFSPSDFFFSDWVIDNGFGGGRTTE